jgi:hypothetical protein
VCAMRAAAWCSRLAEERVRGGAHVCFERPSVVADDREVQRGDGVCTRWVAVRGWCPLLAMGHAMMGVWSVVNSESWTPSGQATKQQRERRRWA